MLAVALANPARAQESNRARFDTLAVRCLAAVPGAAEAFVVEAPEMMPYLRAALVQRWQADGRVLFTADSLASPPSPYPRLRYQVEHAQVGYARAPEREVARTVTLALRYTFLAPDGRLLRDDACRGTLADTLARAALPLVEDPAFPETQAPPPRAGFLRRVVEPAVLTAATAVGVYLFFTLRSE